jgi:hypothetical protein
MPGTVVLLDQVMYEISESRYELVRGPDRN